MTHSPVAALHPLTWLFQRNSSRWAHNATASSLADGIPAPAREHPLDPWQPLPPPALPDVALSRLLRARASCRRFEATPIDVGALATLLAAGYGVLGRSRFGSMEMLERPVPSGGGLYPLEFSVLARHVDGVAAGIHHYHALCHGLEARRDIDLPKPLLDYLFMGQGYATAAPVLIVVSGAFERTLGKYGDRGYRYLLLEAGHAMQNINLCAAALGLGSCNLGGFFDDELGDLLRLEHGVEFPVYAVAIGVPAEDREAGRSPD